MKLNMGVASALIPTSVHSRASYAPTVRRSQVSLVGKSRVPFAEMLQLRQGRRSPIRIDWRSPWTRQTVFCSSTTGAAAEEGAAGQRIIETELRHEAEQSYLSYAMSVIVGRALPDARDGLKPVHRRILYAMHELGLEHTKPFRKCARVVGEVLGKFHPHGDTAVYDALVRMAQEFSMRAPLVNGHGNFGSLDDDPPAAMRYTECRLQPLAAAALLADLDAETVDYLPNFDASTVEPAVLPAKIPNLLVNGSSGIAVGIATKIPPHNMREVVNGLKALIHNPDISVPALMRHIPGPDFPTGGEIIMSDSVQDAYLHGRGSITVRAKMHFEENLKKRPSIVITELPYQTNKADLVANVAKLVDEGKITGVSDIRDESDRSGMRVVIEMKKGAAAKLTANQLMKYTSVQSRFACNMVALVDGLPKTLDLKEFLQAFLKFRCEVVERRAKYELNKSVKRLHLVEGFLVAIKNMTSVINIVRESPEADSAIERLESSFGISREQAVGVMGLTLRRLTSLEQQKLVDEESSLKAKIQDLEDLLARKERVLQIIEEEADEISRQFGTPRRTVITKDDGQAELQEVDIIPNLPSIIVYSRKGYIKRMIAATFAVQSIRGIGKAGTRLKDDDNLEDVVSVNDHDRLLFFTTDGHVHALHAYEVPEASRTAIGTPISQIIKMKPNFMAAMMPVPESAGDIDVIMLTSGGLIKRTNLSQFSKITSRGVTAITLREGDTLKFVSICSPTDSVLLTSSRGLALRFPVEVLRQQGRISQGCKTMNAGDGSLVGMSILPKGLAPPETIDEESNVESIATGPCLFLITKKGLAKRVLISSFQMRKGRVGKGIIALRVKDGDSLAAAVVVGIPQGSSGEDLLISTLNGMLLRVPVSQTVVCSRLAQGYRVVKLKEGDEVGTVTHIINQEC